MDSRQGKTTDVLYSERSLQREKLNHSRAITEFQKVGAESTLKNGLIQPFM